MGNKSRILFLLNWLRENTDEENSVSAAELRKLFQKQGMNATPVTLRNDIATLQESGYDIGVREENGIATWYNYLDREWSMPELQILIDAVSSSQFLTPKKSRELIARLVKMAPPSRRASLQPSILVSELVKAKNSRIFLIVQTIREAIVQDRKIVFRYFRYNLEKKQTLRHGGSKYVISPYATVWKNDRYYLVGWSEAREKVVTFRIDRMTKVFLAGEEDDGEKATDIRRVPAPEDFNLQDYSSKVFFMFDGEETEVTLRCSKDRIDQVIDTFGEGVILKNIKGKTFDITVPVCLSSSFFAWLFQYAGEMTIIAPEKARNWYTGMLEAALDDVLGE